MNENKKQKTQSHIDNYVYSDSILVYNSTNENIKPNNFLKKKKNKE